MEFCLENKWVLTCNKIKKEPREKRFTRSFSFFREAFFMNTYGSSTWKVKFSILLISFRQTPCRTAFPDVTVINYNS